jgi:hypothetical protein
MSFLNPDMNAGRPRSVGLRLDISHLGARVLLSLLATALALHVWRQNRR